MGPSFINEPGRFRTAGTGISRSAAAAAVAAAVIVAAAAVVAATAAATAATAAVAAPAAAAAAAAQNDDQNDDPQAAPAAPTVIAAPHIEVPPVYEVFEAASSPLSITSYAVGRDGCLGRLKIQAGFLAGG